MQLVGDFHIDTLHKMTITYLFTELAEAILSTYTKFVDLIARYPRLTS